MTKCKGCGIRLQNLDPEKVGYTPKLENDLCMRCFKLKNYNVLTNEGVVIDNKEILSKINKKKSYVLFIVDFLNLDKEVIDTYKSITNSKALVLTKCDIIPKNIKINTLVENIKDIYDIKENILICSKNRVNLNEIRNICLEEKNVLFAGFTNAGKSSLINSLVGSNITVSHKSNTTQDFIRLNVDGVTIYDAPGFMSHFKRENVPKNLIKPIVYQLENKYYLKIDNLKLNIQSNSNLTIYMSNTISIDKRREKENVLCDVAVPSNSDLIIKGYGFIKFSKATFIKINTLDYEIRPSIIGGIK